MKHSFECRLMTGIATLTAAINIGCILWNINERNKMLDKERVLDRKIQDVRTDPQGAFNQGYTYAVEDLVRLQLEWAAKEGGTVMIPRDVTTDEAIQKGMKFAAVPYRAVISPKHYLVQVQKFDKKKKGA